ncbi:MAG: Lin0512 family protein [Pseudomonadota bacterium]
MAKKRVAVEFGMGSSLRSEDPTAACIRACKDALWHNSLSIAQAFDQTVDDMIVEVELACQAPDTVDTAEVAKVFPYGRISVSAKPGGLTIQKPDGAGVTIIAHAAIIVSLDLPEAKS